MEISSKICKTKLQGFHKISIKRKRNKCTSLNFLFVSRPSLKVFVLCIMLQLSHTFYYYHEIIICRRNNCSFFFFFYKLLRFAVADPSGNDLGYLTHVFFKIRNLCITLHFKNRVHALSKSV